MSETMEQSNSKVTSLQANAVSINASKVMSLGGEEVTDTVIILSEKRSNDVSMSYNLYLRRVVPAMKNPKVGHVSSYMYFRRRKWYLHFFAFYLEFTVYRMGS